MPRPEDKKREPASQQGPTRKRRILSPLLCCLIVLVFLAATASYFFRYELGLQRLVSNEAIPQPDPERYRMLKEDLEIRRQMLATRYQKAKNNEERAAIQAEASKLLEAVLPDMMRCWLGTPWDFHGTCEGPGEGKIACGYFVSTTLRDAGFKVDRYKLAQQPSQNIIYTFVDRSRAHIRAGMSYSDFLTQMKSYPKGIYIVGLDKHVGFILNHGEGQSIRFIHSSGRTPYRVVDELEPEAISLKYSNYRIIGNLTEESATIEKWLLGQPFSVIR